MMVASTTFFQSVGQRLTVSIHLNHFDLPGEKMDLSNKLLSVMMISPSMTKREFDFIFVASSDDECGSVVVSMPSILSYY